MVIGNLPGFRKEITLAVELAYAAGMKLKEGIWSNEPQTKYHPTFGESTTTEADQKSELLIIDGLAKKFPKAYYGAEEMVKDSGIAWDPSINKSFFVDPRDGTTESIHDLSNWSVSIGYMEDNLHIGGAIFAPDVRDGLLIAGERGLGVRFMDHGHGRKEAAILHPNAPPPKKPVLYIGLDVQRRRDIYHPFLQNLPQALVPRGIAQSCALGMALVALGRVDVFVQSPQFPWDWCAGRAIALEVGCTIIDYELVDERVVRLKIPSKRHYDTSKQTLGFVMGHGALAEAAFTVLQESLR